MKFGKTMRATVETADPEFAAYYMSYKDLKRHLPDIHTAPPASNHPPAVNAPFFRTLKCEVDKVNDFFLDKQEDHVIEAAELSARVRVLVAAGHAAVDRTAVDRLVARLADFRASLVRLDEFTSVNYTGFRKILKKHDKKTGLRIQRHYLSVVKVTPFLLSDTVRGLMTSVDAQSAQLAQLIKRPRHNPIACVGYSNGGGGASSAGEGAGHVAPLPYVPPLSVGNGRPTSSLYRVWAHASAGGGPGLLRAIDEMCGSEIGLDAEFVRRAEVPGNYVVVRAERLIVGVFVTEGTPVQILRREGAEGVVTKLISGRAEMAVFARRYRGESSVETVVEGPVEERGRSDEESGFEVTDRRGGAVVGSWPAIGCLESDCGVQYTPVGKDRIAVLYCADPEVVMSCVPRFTLTPISAVEGDCGKPFLVRRDTEVGGGVAVVTSS